MILEISAPLPFGTLLRELRASIGLTQADLAARAGLSVRGISDLERGARKAPHPHTVRQLAAALLLTDEQSGELLAAARRGVGASGRLRTRQPNPRRHLHVHAFRPRSRRSTSTAGSPR